MPRRYRVTVARLCESVHSVTCRITDRGLRPKILFVRRNAATRRWRDEKAVLAHLKAANPVDRFRNVRGWIKGV
eukprot:s5065_g2.t1